MTTGQLVNRDSDAFSVQRTQPLYDQKLIPAEKKPFLIDLQKSGGALMSVENGPFILDVASQIASLGLGFNAGAMFGAAQFLESWTGKKNTPSIQKVRAAFHQLLCDKCGWTDIHLHLCNSGAEANETALGNCYRLRRNTQAQKVLAFEGSFHGRMMVALASTWNVTKREPFRWDGFETSFAPYPEMEGDDVSAPAIPEGWQATWKNLFQLSPARARQEVDGRFQTDDDLLGREIDALLLVHELLSRGEHYAVLIEPMQCEGGDRYSSARFHHGLVNLVKGFEISLVYDEIQTGFGLGGDFFWHRKFDLRDQDGQLLFPDYIVMAKKAQVGGVISHQDIPWVEQFNTTSLTRGYIQASLLDQFQSEIEKIEQRSRDELKLLMDDFASAICRPRVSGMCFAFDFVNPEHLPRFIGTRFRHGLLYYPAGKHSARFRFNLACRGETLDLAWKQIRAALSDTVTQKAAVSTIGCPVPQVDPYFDFHERLISGKLEGLHGNPQAQGVVTDFLNTALGNFGIDGKIVFLKPDNWQTFRQQVWDMQGLIYEPLRQTAIGKFDQLIEAENSLAFLVLKDDRIIAMAFAAPPQNFPDERGLAEDPFFRDLETLYMLDLTVVPEYQGKLGRVMKQALCLAAQAAGREAIQGRNRDRVARGMWAINLSLGAYCTQLLRDDYVDDLPFRDCLMYRSELVWRDPGISLSTGVEQPLEASDLNARFCRENLASIPNKLTLSNFVTADYLEQLDRVCSLLPSPLQHCYTASGMSECVDKLIKTIWLRRKPRKKIIRIGNPFVGHGSFLSRSVSGVEGSLFPFTSLPNDGHLLQSLERELSKDDVIAVFIEPVQWLDGERFTPEQLTAIQACCRAQATPLVTHESAGMFHRYRSDVFLPAAIPEFEPDAGMIFLGGQMAICFMREDYFEETPLMFISTWDGDLFSMAQFNRAIDVAETQAMPELATDYQGALQGVLERQGITNMNLSGAAGWFEGQPKDSIAGMFRKNAAGRFVSCPSVTGMRQFLENLEGFDE